MGAAGAAVAIPFLASCSQGSGMPGRTPKPGEQIASVSDLADGQTLVVMTAAGTPVVLSRDGDEIRALSGVCPHQGCAVRQEVAGLLCPCHNSKFDFGGKLISGPAGSDLPPTTIHVEDGRIITGP